MSRELIILGTAAQVPTRERNHNGYFLRWDEYGFLFDPGEGTQRQMTYADLAASAISHLCITHFHGDHCLGLPGVIQRLSLDKSPRTIRTCYPHSGDCFFQAMRNASLFQNNVQIEATLLDGPREVYRNDDFVFSAMPLDHRVECYGYRIQETEHRTVSMEKIAALGIELRGPEIGILKKDGQLALANGTVLHLADVSTARPTQSFAFVMDTRPCDGALALAQNVDMLVCEATYLETESKQAHEYMHMTARRAAEIAKAANAKQLILSHFSQRYGSLDEHLREARAVFENTYIARDLMRFALPKNARTK